jgi:ribosomal protein S18 acetylase RimI-like enzyme
MGCASPLPRRLVDSPTGSRSMTTLLIRPMTKRDVAQVRALESAVDGEASFSRQLPAWLKQTNRTGLIAESGEPVGYLAYRFDVDDWQLVLEQIAVHPRARRRGVGRQLLARLLEVCRGLEGSRVHVAVPESMVGVQLFLKANGFRAARIIETEPGEVSYWFEYRDTPDTLAGPPEGTYNLGERSG